MSFTASDGRRFQNELQGRHYEQALAREKAQKTLEKAPGGYFAPSALRENGFVKRVTIEREDNGRHRVTAEHFNGKSSTQVLPEAHQAHEIAAQLLEIAPPPAIMTHVRSRQFPVGEKENRELRRADGQEDTPDAAEPGS